MTAPDSIYQLVEKFDRDKPGSETELRDWYVDPLFAALGWDLQAKQQVRKEPSVSVWEEGLERSKRADYSFHIGNARHFFVETKMPHINLERNSTPAFQLRRYGWSGGTPVSVLTDFEEFCVYDCRIEPHQRDPAATARLRYWTYQNYIDDWDEIASRFHREAVAQGALREWVEGERARGVSSVDQAFLREMENWRELLAKDIALHNRDLSQRQLNLLVQRTIDRIVFLRIAEDRDIEAYGRLRSAAEAGRQVYADLKILFIEADDKYNSGLFHFGVDERASAPDSVSLNIHIPDEPLRHIIKHLYFPDSPYEFSVMPPEILGQVYEQFLGKVIEFSPGGAVRVEQKPEARKAGGVYYTPAYIVDYIVENTVGELLKDLTPAQAAKLRILDPACGSGSFLVGAYNYLLDWHLKTYSREPERHKNVLRRIAGGYVLATAEKRRILQNSIYGVDLDQNAVEVSKLSLLLKMLENESDAAGRQTLMFAAGGRILPDLSDNIKWGNSLIGSDFFRGPQATLFDDEEAMQRVKAFDWESEAGFGEIMRAGGFDVVIGNPPWLMAGYYSKNTLNHMKANWRTAKGKFDLYYLFLELSTRLCNKNGTIGMIVPNKCFHTRSASELRRLLASDIYIDRIVDFGDEQIFAGATNYSSILILNNDSDGSPLYSKALKGLTITQEFAVTRDQLSSKIWSFVPPETRKLFDKLESLGYPLSNFVQRFGTGVQTGADKILTFTEAQVLNLGLERQLLKPMLRGRDVRRYCHTSASKLTIFPYRVLGGEYQILDERELEAHERILSVLEENKQRLSKRIWFGKSAEELSGKWYGMMYLDSYNSFSKPHLLTPSLSNVSNFTLGNGDIFATGTAGVTSVIPKDTNDEHINYFLGVLNSKVLNFYATKNSPIFSGGYYKFSAPYLKDLPVRKIEFDRATDKAIHDKLVELVDEIMELYKRLPGLSGEGRRVTETLIQTVDIEIDTLVYKLYGLTDDEVAIVEGG